MSQREMARSRLASKTERLNRASRLLHWVDHYSSLPWVAMLLAGFLVAAVAIGAALGFPTGWTTAFEVCTSIVTLMMVVTIQHTQGRAQTATQRKLDELLRANPSAGESFIMLEEESDETIHDVEQEQRSSRDDNRP
ncbi:MAG TPA: low affinity iron permease family protein [Acidimicrobiales bacterium]|jgi:low affinity Fe/Cu permease